MSSPERVIQGVNCRLGKKTKNGPLSASPSDLLTLRAIGGPSSTKMRLGFAVMLHSYDDISLFVPLLDIPVSLNDFLQGIASIYDRF